jgi:tRNA A-37 threonylcarbamoyl transferase component Bud32
MFEELIENAENYRIGNNYRATNIVFPVEFNGKKYVVKRPRTSVVSSLVQSYYFFQENLSLKNRANNSARLGLLREIEKLRELAGFHAPRLYGSDTEKPLIVREYLEGRDFRNLSSDEEIERTLEGAIEALEGIHEKGVMVGDAHIKNTCLTDEGEVYWLDFDGVFDESDAVRSKAQDLLKYVYSTYTVTRDKDKTLYAAELVARGYQGKEVRESLSELVSGLESGLRLWFSTRLPLDGKLHEEIKRVLTR